MDDKLAKRLVDTYIEKIKEKGWEVLSERFLIKHTEMEIKKGEKQYKIKAANENAEFPDHCRLKCLMKIWKEVND